MSVSPFPDDLRVEYDAQLLDVQARRAKARQLQVALEYAQLWNEPKRILDVGCGSGLTLSALDAPNTQRVGCDVRSELYEQSPGQGIIEFTRADCAQLPLVSGAFDLVMCLAVIGEFPDPQTALTEMARCVAPGGCLYVTVANSPMLLRRYALEERLGRHIRTSWWSYAHACMPMYQYAPAEGWGVCELERWKFVDLTLALARAVKPHLKFVPAPLLERIIKVTVPSFAYVWRRPI